MGNRWNGRQQVTMFLDSEHNTWSDEANYADHGIFLNLGGAGFSRTTATQGAQWGSAGIPLLFSGAPMGPMGPRGLGGLGNIVYGIILETLRVIYREN